MSRPCTQLLTGTIFQNKKKQKKDWQKWMDNSNGPTSSCIYLCAAISSGQQLIVTSIIQRIKRYGMKKKKNGQPRTATNKKKLADRKDKRKQKGSA